MSQTDIEWATAHWEPVGGCTDASDGCAHCYARERQLPRLSASLTDRTSPAAVQERLSRYAGLVQKAPLGADRNYQWTGKLVLWPDRLVAPLKWRKPRGRVFVCSQSDLFHEDRSDEDIGAVFAVMAMCPKTTFLVLTKRAARMQRWAEQYRNDLILRLHDDLGCVEDPTPTVDELGTTQLDLWIEDRLLTIDWDTWPLPNVWLGVSVENQKRADERIPQLLATPAAKRFVSYEPALGPLELQDQRSWLEPFKETDPLLQRTPRLDWVIAGAESSHGKRPGRRARPQWFRDVRDQCEAAGVPFFLKQMEMAVPLNSDESVQRIVGTPELDGRQWTEVPQ